MVPVVSRAADVGTAWLRRHRPATRPRIRLVCFPHAGGNAGAFRSWVPLLPADVELVAVQYPGRQDRLTEPCVSDMATLADSVTAAVLGLADGPIALFGHSMGAAVAYEVALRLERRHAVRPVHLFVSGHKPPTAARTRAWLHDRDDDELLAGLRDLGGLDPSVFEDPELRPLVLPALRADLRLVETYRPAPARPVNVAVTAYAGTADADVQAGHLDAWRSLTTGGFASRRFPGGHFYLREHEAPLLADVVDRLTQTGAIRGVAR